MNKHLALISFSILVITLVVMIYLIYNKHNQKEPFEEVRTLEENDELGEDEMPLDGSISFDSPMEELMFTAMFANPDRFESIMKILGVNNEQELDSLMTDLEDNYETKEQELKDRLETDKDLTTIINEYNEVANELDELTVNDRYSEVPEDLELKINELPDTIKGSLCADYCEIADDCTPTCEKLECSSCSIDVNSEIQEIINDPSSIYRQPDEIEQNQVPATIINRHIMEVPKADINNSNNGKSNVFAPYVVIHKKKKGQMYKPYVMSNPYDPNYYSYINNLS